MQNLYISEGSLKSNRTCSEDLFTSGWWSNVTSIWTFYRTPNYRRGLGIPFLRRNSGLRLGLFFSGITKFRTVFCWALAVFFLKRKYRMVGLLKSVRKHIAISILNVLTLFSIIILCFVSTRIVRFTLRPSKISDFLLLTILGRRGHCLGLRECLRYLIP